MQIPIKTLDDENTNFRSTGGHGLDGLCLLKIFLSSLFIQSSFNYRNMQGLGFAFSMLPLARRMRDDKERLSAFLARHLQMFNTHPYLSGPIIGSVAGMEAANAGKGDEDSDITGVKNALMGPYAAIGDPFFWGALKPFAAIFSVILAFQRLILAPLVFLILYNPAHLWIRIGGFVDGCCRGKNGIDFIRRLDLPLFTAKIRWISLIGLGCMATLIGGGIHMSHLGLSFNIITKGVFLALVVLCYWGIRNGISQVKMLYWTFIISCAVSL